MTTQTLRSLSMASPDGTPVWTEVDRYGGHYQADRANPAYRPEVLLVFVHGFLGHFETTWGDLPFQLMRRAAIDVDAFSFRYPSLPWERLNLKREARVLASVLRERYPAGEFDDHGGVRRGYRQIVIVTHSAGGLLVKEMLRQEARASDAAHGDRRSGLVSDDIVSRVRRIINLSVPHIGGRPAITIPLFLIYHALFFASFIALYAVSALTQGSKNWGYYDLGYRLLWRNGWARRLDQDFRQLSATRSEHALPFPHASNIEGSTDAAVPLVDDNVTQGGTSIVRAKHTSIQKPDSLDDPVLSYVSSRISYATTVPRHLVADRTVLRGALIDTRDHVRELLAEGDSTSTSQGGAGRSSLAQHQALDALVNALKDGQRGGAILLTGNAGVGKSSVLRRAAQLLSIRSLQEQPWSSTKGQPILPITCPLQQITLPPNRLDAIVTSSQPGRLLLESILDSWCEWVNGSLIYSNATTRDWVIREIERGPCALLLDGVDEFLVLNPRLRSSDIIDLITWIETKTHDMPTRPVVLLAIRSTHPQAASMRPHVRAVVEVKTLSRQEAKRFAPDLEPLIDRADAVTADDVLLTPLVLERLRGRAAEIESKRLTDQASIVAIALDGIVKESGVESMARGMGHSITHDEIIDALTAVGWAFFSERRADLSASVIKQQLAKMRADWLPSSETRNIHSTAHGIGHACDILTLPQLLELLLMRTVFHGLGRERYRPSHALWADHLAARYLAAALQTAQYSAVAEIGGTETAYRLAGQILAADGWEVDETIVAAMLQAGQQRPASFIGTNFLGVLVTSLIPVSGPAVSLMIAASSKMDLLARIVLYNGVNRRALANDSRDPSARTLRGAFLPTLHQIAESSTEIALLRSIAFCYASAYSTLWGTAPPKSAWHERLGDRDQHAQDVLSLVCDTKLEPLAPGPAHRYVQLAWAEILRTAVEDPARPISLVHYLFVLVAACQYCVQIPEVDRELTNVFSPESRLRSALSGYAIVPVVGDIFNACHAAWNNRAGRGPNDGMRQPLA